MTKLCKLKWQLRPHPAYSPDLAPSDFHLFEPHKDPLHGKKFGFESGLKSAMKKVVKTTSKDWFEKGVKKAAERWRKCIDLLRDYVEKKTLFHYFVIFCFKNITVCAELLVCPSYYLKVAKISPHHIL